MSLALVQDYSSSSEKEVIDSSDYDSDGSAGDGGGSTAVSQHETTSGSLGVDLPNEQWKSSTSLPSAASVFSEVTGPPDYLKDSMGDLIAVQPRRVSEKKNADVVKEAKPQLVASLASYQSDQNNSKQDDRPEDAARHLGVCPVCAVPKTYSAVKEGLVCPVCKDRFATDIDADTKKRGSRIKDKERSKRMKGQSSHATWKSETEMQLRQQFD